MKSSRLWIEGTWEDGASVVVLERKFDGAPLAEVHHASAEQVARATAAVAEAQRRAPVAAHDRFLVLDRAARLVEERRTQLVRTMIDEAGFTVRDSNGEVARAAQTLRLSGQEATRLTGEMVPLEGAPGVDGRMGFTLRFPVGVVCAITPFNSPLNTVAHKVGPALAAGNGVVLKPATATPLTAAALLEILLEAGLPPTHVALLQGGGTTVGEALLTDPNINFYTFTGSTAVGERIHRGAGLRRTQLELGSLSSTIVCHDADLDLAVPKCVGAAFRKAGQVCTSVQRLYVHEEIEEDFTTRLLKAVGELQAGDPADPNTFVGPLISRQAAQRVEDWIQEAAADGAAVLVGGDRDGRVVAPTVLSGVKPTMKVMCEEIFGPVVSLRRFANLDEAIAEVNDTPYGLAAGVFTADITRGFRAAHGLHMGSVHINETSSSRVDLMPYGGAKRSGFGLEGPRYAIQEMTEPRLVTIAYR